MLPFMEPWQLVASVGVLQHMLITTWQAEAAGVSRSALSSRVRRHGWTRFERGVIGLPGPDSDLRRLTAAVLTYARPTGAAGRIDIGHNSDAWPQAFAAAALGAGQAVTGRSGAWLHGFARRPEQHWLWLPADSGRAKRAGVALRYGGLPAGSIQQHRGLPVLDPEGCIAETARTPLGTYSQRVDELLWLMSRADSLRIATLDSVEDRALSLGVFIGCDVLRAAIARGRGTMSHSRVEHRGRALVATALEPFGLQPAPRPHEVWVGGRRIAEADIAVLPICLDIEVDGPHHRFLAQRLKDDQRDRLLRRAGWAVERLPSELVDERPQVFMARVRDAAEARLRMLAPA